MFWPPIIISSQVLDLFLLLYLSTEPTAGWSATPETPKMVYTPEKVPEIPWKLGWSLKKYEKKPMKIGM